MHGPFCHVYKWLDSLKAKAKLLEPWARMGHDHACEWAWKQADRSGFQVWFWWLFTKNATFHELLALFHDLGIEIYKYMIDLNYRNIKSSIKKKINNNNKGHNIVHWSNSFTYSNFSSILYVLEEKQKCSSNFFFKSCLILQIIYRESL